MLEVCRASLNLGAAFHRGTGRARLWRRDTPKRGAHAKYGEPTRLDNGPEFVAQALCDWAAAKGIELGHTQPGQPTQNAYLERFITSHRSMCRRIQSCSAILRG